MQTLDNNRTTGFSLRRSLIQQGVSDAELQKHVDFMATTIAVYPRADITKYRAHQPSA